MAEFVHLHVHSQYSMLDGAIKVKNLVKQVGAAGMKAVARHRPRQHVRRDHLLQGGEGGGRAGDPRAASSRSRRAATRTTCPLLAASNEGYKNLVWLVSRGHVAPEPAGPAGAPCVSLEHARGAHARASSALTGCMGGVVAQAVLEQGVEAGREDARPAEGALRAGLLYVELQDHGLPEQPILNGILVDLAKRVELPLVATNDVHYGEQDDAEAHLYLSCIKTGRSYEESKERGITARARCT